MESWKINDNILEYEDSTHTYLIDGVIVQSVTQTLKDDKYVYVNPQVLQRASERGTAVHKAIEEYCKTGIAETLEQKHFKFLQDTYKFKVIANELPVIIYSDPMIAGRLDLILEIDGILAVADIKTTSTLYKDSVTKQLNLYKRGYEESYHKKIQKLYAIHIKEDKRKLIELPILEG